MSSHDGITRRALLKAASVTGVGMAVGTGVTTANAAWGLGKSKLSFKNEDFYGKDGTFNVEAGKDAIITLMKYHGYPVFDDTREKLWVSDYGTGEFTRLGLAANMFINNEAEHVGDRFMLMDLFLLPNQMLPEHYHLETDKARPKMEAWLVRHGMSYIIGEGEPTTGIKEMMPESQRASATVFHAAKTLPGTWVKLNRPTARHSQLAGPEGAIISEVANFHDNAGVRHSNEKLLFG